MSGNVCGVDKSGRGATQAASAEEQARVESHSNSLALFKGKERLWEQRRIGGVGRGRDSCVGELVHD